MGAAEGMFSAVRPTRMADDATSVRATHFRKTNSFCWVQRCEERHKHATLQKHAFRHERLHKPSSCPDHALRSVTWTWHQRTVTTHYLFKTTLSPFSLTHRCFLDDQFTLSFRTRRPGSLNRLWRWSKLVGRTREQTSSEIQSNCRCLANVLGISEVPLSRHSLTFRGRQDLSLFKLNKVLVR